MKEFEVWESVGEVRLREGSDSIGHVVERLVSAPECEVCCACLDMCLSPSYVTLEVASIGAESGLEVGVFPVVWPFERFVGNVDTALGVRYDLCDEVVGEMATELQRCVDSDKLHGECACRSDVLSVCDLKADEWGVVFPGVVSWC